MPEFCPKCGNMVADGTERCPACGKRLQPRVMDQRTGFTWADFFNYTGFTLAFLIGIVLIGVLIILGCMGIVTLLGQ